METMRFSVRLLLLTLCVSAAAVLCVPSRAAAPGRLRGVVIDPSGKTVWTPAQWSEHLDAIAAGGFDVYVAAWTSRNGFSLYPSKTRKPFPSAQTPDVVTLIIDAAAKSGAEVWLGLDGTVDSAEVYDDDFAPAAERAKRAMDELLELHGANKRLKGFLLPAEGDGIPDKNEGEFIRETVAYLRAGAPGLKLAARVRKPAYLRRGSQVQPALFGIRDYAAYMSYDYKKLEALLEGDELSERWLGAWRKVLEKDGPDVLIYMDGVGSMRSFPGRMRYDLSRLRAVADQGGAELWDATDLFTLVRAPGDEDPPAAHPLPREKLERNLDIAAEFTDTIIGYSSDHLSPPPPGPLRVSDPAADELYRKALRVEEIIHSRHDMEGQIITYRNMLYHIDHPYNDWQEDACWLTGLYAAAESFRYAATGDDEAREYARRAWRALRKMANVTPQPGIVVRYYKRDMYAYNPTATAKKRWYKDPAREMYFTPDISRDQLSGYFMGIAAYYDHVADAAERELIREDVALIMKPIMDNDMTAVEFDGTPTTYGALDESPLLALNFLLIAHHITGGGEYRKKYLELVARGWLQKAVENSATTYNHFFEHFDDSAYYHALQYEVDEKQLAVAAAGLDFLYAKALPHGNAHLLFDVARYRPWSDAAAMGLTELLAYNPEQLYVADWAAKPPVVQTDSSYIRLGDRRPQEYFWNWFPGSKVMQGSPETEFSGVDFLLAYWMARWNGSIY